MICGGGADARRERCRRIRLRSPAIVADLVIARRLRPAQLQPVERRFAGQRRAIRAPGFELAAPASPSPDRGATGRGRSDPRNPAPPRIPAARPAGHRVFDQLRRAAIREARRRTARSTGWPGRWPRAASPRPPNSSCRRQTRPPPPALQCVQIPTDPRYTLSASGFPGLRDKPFSQHDFLRSRAPMHYPL